MSPNLYAAFSDPTEGRKAIEALVASGVDRSSITMICKDCELPVLSTDQADLGGMGSVMPDLRAGAVSGSFESMGSAGDRLAGIAASANASANPGNMSDFLWGSLPTDVAKAYQPDYDGGRVIVVVHNPSLAAESTMKEQGALKMSKQGYLA